MKYIVLLTALLVAVACDQIGYSTQSPDAPEPLPILGDSEVIDGVTVHHTIPDFTFINQDSVVVTNASFQDKIYVADFFFTYCPTICPKLTKQMIRLYDEFEKEDRLRLLSHALDTKRDTIGRLHEYAHNLGVTSDRWHFVTGEKYDIAEIADDYFSIVIEDPNAPGGFDHSGRIILVDENRHVRSFADGTNPDEISRLIGDIKQLLAEGQTEESAAN